MKVLILTPINPILTQELYVTLQKKYHKTNVEVISFPFFAEMQSMLKNKSYIISYFAMLLSSLQPEVHKILYKKQNLIFIGNTYKDEKFDLILSFGFDENEVFDTYIETIKTNEDLEFIKNYSYIDNLYGPKDASINLPTIEHVKLFLEGVYK